MKKFLTVGIAGIFALSAVLGLAACGDPDESGDNNDPPKQEEPEVPEVPDRDAPAFASADATLSLTGTIDKTTARNQISADLFGLFLEDINYAGYALDDNLISNSSFESIQGSKTAGWNHSSAPFTVKSTGGVFADNSDFTGANPNYIEVNALANGYIYNTGFYAVPVAVEEGVDYVFSAFIKTKNYAGDITVEVTNGTKVYATKDITLTASNDWVKYQTTLTAAETGTSGLQVRIRFHSAGTVCLDNIMLETKDATDFGMKNYLYNAIKDLSPAFFRFPGGCIIEGKDDSSYYDWKNSIGAVKTGSGDKVPAFTYTLVEDGNSKTVTSYGEQATRSYNTDIWYGTNYYQMEYGIGFYEYFLLCESLGAKAIPIVNCGKACQAQSTGGALQGRHNHGVDDFIQDAKDLIAFAIGDVDSDDENEAYWAQVRANMGHPEPFEMDYIGIGNEQWGDYYNRYYEQFLESFLLDDNPLYMTVTPIVGNCTLFENCENPVADGGTKTGVAEAAAKTCLINKNIINNVAEYGVHDQHYYMNYTDFFANAHLYDDYKRPDTDPDTYYEVFVGEYSANATVACSPKQEYLGQQYRCTFNSVLTALSEAAMMTGYERNGDIVKLAAYAPMFGNYTQNQWAVNMMYFTNNDVVLTPNYYVQQLFMKNSGDHKVNSSLTFAGEIPQTTYFSTNSGAKRTYDDVYFVTSADEETGDIIVKIVNAGSEDFDLNIEFSLTGVKNKGIAYITELSSLEADKTSTLTGGSAWTPYSEIVGNFTNGTMGYTVHGYSVSAIRIRTTK